MSGSNSDKYMLAGRYRLIAEVGRGGMADVYLAATQQGIGGFKKLVVVKILRQSVVQDDEEVVRMFLDEARLAARLNHPNVVQTNEVGQDAGRYYMVMEYLEGQPMERIVRHPLASRRFPLRMRLHALAKALAGLHYAHDLADYDGTPLHVVHRDVSPSNIFVTYDGHAKLVDFGIAKAVNASHETRVGMFKGKTRYMAPEQLSLGSQVDRRTDVYSSGVVLWEMLTGTRMWNGVTSGDVLRRLVAGDLPTPRSVNPLVPGELERICIKALSLAPENRYPTAAALEIELEAYSRRHPPQATDREVGTELKEMFAPERAKMKAAIEAQLTAAPPKDDDLPSIPVSLGTSDGSTSSFTKDGTAASETLSPPPSRVVFVASDAPGPPAASAPPPASSFPSVESSAQSGAVSALSGEIGLLRVMVARFYSRYATKRVAMVAIGAAGALRIAVLWMVVGAFARGSDATKRAAIGEASGPTAAVASHGTASAPSSFVAPVHRVRGVSESEILCGMSAAFSGPSRELGNRMKLGVETAFSVVDDQGGVNGRALKLVALDDGYEGARAGDNMKELIEDRGVFGIIGNVGTPTAQVAAPYAASHKTLFFGAFTGAKVLRQEPPDRYVFNYRASYEEETAKMVRYLVEAKKVAPAGIVVFAQHDGYGDAGFEGVAKTMRKYGRGDADILRVNYERNTADVEGAVREVVRYDAIHRVSAVVMVATYKAAARFIERVKDRRLNPVLMNVSFVGSNALLEELKEAGPGYAPGVVVTQVVPPYDSGGTGVLRYREALNRYHPDQQPDFVSLEGYVVGTLFAEGLRRAGRDLDTEKVVDALEALRNYDLGIGTIVNFGLSEHQGSHKVWGTVVDAQGTFQPLDMD